MNGPISLSPKSDPSYSINEYDQDVRGTVTDYQLRLLQETYLPDDTEPKQKYSPFEPTSLFMMVCSIIRILTELTILIYISFVWSFNVSKSTVQTIGCILSIILFLDMIIQLNQAFIVQGQIVKQHNKIWRRYLQDQGLRDAVSFCCLLLISQLQVQPLIIVYYILSVKKIHFTLSSIQWQFHNNEILSATKLLIIFLLMSHNFACLWHYVGQSSIQSGQDSWITKLQFNSSPTIGTLYSYSLYWSTMTMVTIGNSNVQAQNNIEVIVATLTMFLTFTFLIYIIFTVTKRDQNPKKQFNEYMSSQQVGSQLQGRIRNYLEYCASQGRKTNDKEIQKNHDKLSTPLRLELFRQVRGKTLQLCELLKTNFSENTLQKILPHMQTLSYKPEDIIIKQNTQDDCALFIILKGDVQVQFYDRVVRKLQNGDHFGERSFFSGQERICSVKAVGFVRVYKISQEVFLEALANATDRERWCYMRDSILMYEDYSVIGMQCYSCKKFGHLITKCPILMYRVDLERVLKKDSYSSGQLRSPYKRYGSKHNTLEIFQQIQETTKEFRYIVLNQAQDAEEDEDDGYTEENLNDSQSLVMDSSPLINKMRQTSIKNQEQYQGDIFSMLGTGSYKRLQDANISISREGVREQQSLSIPSSRNVLIDDKDEGENAILLPSVFPRQSIQKGTLDTASFNEDLQVDEPIERDLKRNTSLKINTSQELSITLQVPNQRGEQRSKKPHHMTLLETNVAQYVDKRSNTVRPIDAEDPDLLTIQQRKLLQRTITNQRNKKFTFKERSPSILPAISEEESDTIIRQNLQSQEELLQTSNPRSTGKNSSISLNRISSKLSSIPYPQRVHTSTLTATYFAHSTLTPKHKDTQSEYNFVDLSVFHKQKEQDLEYDQMCQYDVYFPHNNYEVVVKRYNRFIKIKNSSPTSPSRYTFYDNIKKIIQNRKLMYG